MDKLLAALHRQGFKVQQTKPGGWIVRQDGRTVARGPVVDSSDFIDFVGQLRAIGLVFPQEE